MTPAAQTSEPRTADCFHRVVHGLTNWVDDGKGNTVPDGCYWYCYDCGVPFRPEAAALPTSPDVVEARDVLLRWARGFGPTQVIYDGDRRVGSVREVVERALAALPAAAPAPLDVERLEAAYDRHFDAPDHDECGSACFQTFMAAYAATDPDAKEAGE